MIAVLRYVQELMDWYLNFAFPIYVFVFLLSAGLIIFDNWLRIVCSGIMHVCRYMDAYHKSFLTMLLYVFASVLNEVSRLLRFPSDVVRRAYIIEASLCFMMAFLLGGGLIYSTIEIVIMLQTA